MQLEDEPADAGKRLVAENLFPLGAFRRMVWHMVLSPAWILLTLTPTLGFVMGVVKGELPLTMTAHTAVYLLRTISWGAILILALPRAAHWCMTRNLPFVLAYLGLLFASLVLANIVSLAMVEEAERPMLVIRVLRQLGFGGLLSVILFLLIEKDIRSLGSDPELVPVWWPVRPRMEEHPEGQVSPAADISLLDPALSGSILSIQAQNQYVEVATKERMHLLRMPFHAALAKMPTAAGHRVHRSWWLANDLPIALEKVGQNHEARDSAGRSYPVSRPNLDLVRSLVERNTAAKTAQAPDQAETA